MENKEIFRDEKNRSVFLPLILSILIVAVLVGCFIWLGIRKPDVFASVRDFILTMFLLSFFLLGAVISVLCFLIASKIDTAILKIRELLNTADGKVEELAEKIVEILRKILDPVVAAKSKTSGFFQLFSGKKSGN